MGRSKKRRGAPTDAAATSACCSFSPEAAGADLTYVIVVLNSGPVGATDVDLLMQVPAGTTFVSGLNCSCSVEPSS